MKILIVKVYLYRIFSELILLYPLYTVMFAERGGLSMVQIAFLLALWSLIIFISEIPAGILADMYSRKFLLGVAQLIRAAGFTVWVLWPTFEGFLIGLALWGIGRSLTSGTFEALVYDELKAAHKEKSYARIFGRSESLALFFGLGTTLAAAPVFAWGGYDAIIWGSVIATVVSAGIAFTLPSKTRRMTVEKPPYYVVVREAVREVRKTPVLLKLIVFGVFIGVLFRVFDEYSSLIISSAGTPTVLIPVVSVLLFLPVIMADFYAFKLEKLRQSVFMVATIMAGMMLIVAGKWLSIPGLIAFAAFLLFIKVAITVFNAKVQHAITGQARATITSMNNFGVEAGAIASFMMYGALANALGMSTALVVFGIAVASVGCVYLAIRGRGLFGRIPI